MPRRVGERNPAIDRRPELTVRQVLIGLLKYVRTDYGGQNQESIIGARLTEAGIPNVPMARKAYKLGASQTRNTIKKYMKPQVDFLRQTLGI
jgi:hypothetical protein